MPLKEDQGATSYPLYPLRFVPVLKDYIWGGRGLETYLGRELPPQVDIAESWEISAHRNGDVVVANGPFAGRTLSSLREELGLQLIGTRATWAQKRDKFPLLVKILDANRRLSVQVHPDDEYAQAHEGNELGKSEMWVVLHADADAAITLGLQRETSREELRQALQSDELEPLLHEIPLATGDFVCVPAGSLHAILGGALIAEIQQNSDTTYRVYDWGRLGHDGRPRPLHIEQALDVINFDQIAPRLPEPELISEVAGIRRWLLCQTPYFVTERVEVAAGAQISSSCNGTTLQIWGAIAGEVEIFAGQQTLHLPAVNFTLFPAAMGDYTITAHQSSTLLYTYLPEQEGTRLDSP